MRRNFIFLLVSLAAIAQSGCKMIDVMGTPTNHEKRIPAEYNLAEYSTQKILVLVEQPGWLRANVNLRYYITNSLNKGISKKVGIPAENFVDYEQISQLRSAHTNYSALSPVAIGKALKADKVLYVSITGYNMEKVKDFEYYKGFLSAETVMFDVKTQKKVWPDKKDTKSIKVGFEIEQKGTDVAVSRLVSALEYCITRYFYDCKITKFKIGDDRSDNAWNNWN